MTNHPCKGMSRAQVRAFERIAINSPPNAKPETIKYLLARGKIERSPDKIFGRDDFGTISIPQFHVPLPLHMQWCEWCSEQ